MKAMRNTIFVKRRAGANQPSYDMRLLSRSRTYQVRVLASQDTCFLFCRRNRRFRPDLIPPLFCSPRAWKDQQQSSTLCLTPRFFSVEATEKECVALAERFSCDSITGLKADLRVVRAAGSEARKIKIKVPLAC